MNPVLARNEMLVIKTDGTETRISGQPTLEKIKQYIGDELDFVRIGRLEGTDLTMAVIDRAWKTKTIKHSDHIELKPIEPLYPINEKATKLYHAICRPGTTHQIAGDVVIFHDDAFV